MPITDQVPELIRRFEPVLYFHPDERFVPSDAKRYIEKSAIWTVNASPRDLKDYWGGSRPGHFPRHPRFSPPLAAATGEPGHPVDAPKEGGVEELFLDLAGWRESDGVTSGSDNSYADLDEIADRYGSQLDNGTDKRLQDSRFWYHAEVFDLVRMRSLIVPNSNPNLLDAVEALPPDSALLCYYLFFPGSDGGIEGCMEDASSFDHHAGQWTCISLLLEGTTPPGNNPRTVYNPVSIAMTSRHPDVITTAETDVHHFGMVAEDWSLVANIARDRGPGNDPGAHPLIYVAKQTHGFYLSPGQQRTFPIPLSDGPRLTCGAFESFADLTEHEGAEAAGHEAQKEKNRLVWWLLLFGGPVGFFIGFGNAGGVAGMADLGGPDYRAPTQFDHPPDAGTFGFVIHPEGVTPPNVVTGKKVTWPRFGGETRMTTNEFAREYSLMVGSVVTTFSRPPWMPSDDHTKGYLGRWGNRVTKDPQSRRAGMPFIEYWELSLLAIRKKASMP